MLKGGLSEFEQIYTCLEPACGERSAVPTTTCRCCGSIKISVRSVLKKEGGYFISLPNKEKRHPLLEDELDD